MSTISFKNKIERTVVLDPALTNGKPLPIGTVDNYTRNDVEISVNIRLFEDLPKEIVEAVERNPACIRILERLSPPSEVLILPTTPKLII